MIDIGQFDQLVSTGRCGQDFDQTFSYDRELTETFKYRKVMLNSSAYERADMIVAERKLQAKEQGHAFEHNKREKKYLAQQPKITLRQEQQKKRGFGFGM